VSGKYMVEMDASELQDVFTSKNLTLALAESGTGGLLAKTITDVPGSSQFFIGGVIAYSYELKRTLLDVSSNTLDRYGAVSNDCALEMAKGVMELTGADVGLSATGIAGPDGGTPTKPVGLIFIACFSKDISAIRELHLHGGRMDIRKQTMKAAITLALEAVDR